MSVCTRLMYAGKGTLASSTHFIFPITTGNIHISKENGQSKNLASKIIGCGFRYSPSVMPRNDFFSTHIYKQETTSHFFL